MSLKAIVTVWKKGARIAEGEEDSVWNEIWERAGESRYGYRVITLHAPTQASSKHQAACNRVAAGYSRLRECAQTRAI